MAGLRLEDEFREIIAKKERRIAELRMELAELERDVGKAILALDHMNNGVPETQLPRAELKVPTSIRNGIAAILAEGDRGWELSALTAELEKRMGKPQKSDSVSVILDRMKRAKEVTRRPGQNAWFPPNG